MLFEPTLLVREVAIYRGSSHAYRGSFHEGVNIVSGENSSGKSTILSLIIYGLGADISNWSEHAKLCDRVSIEVALNDPYRDGLPAHISASRSADGDLSGRSGGC